MSIVPDHLLDSALATFREAERLEKNATTAVVLALALGRACALRDMPIDHVLVYVRIGYDAVKQEAAG